ncbi:pyrroloquinoline quinone biosynthesis peptide chaperone PqqD [Streptomyces sp. NPDC001407]|uniref:pyrroloquinoline quinone biosynthesis peptide chaperone PqqD n=1 Tax=Streptomyces sp. NPDC001407 TaxID=3364573 RepID=UPI00369D4DD6
MSAGGAPAPGKAPRGAPGDSACAGVRWRLRRGVRLGHDAVRDAGVLLHPEGVLVLNDTGAAVLALCDGATDERTLTRALARRYVSVSPEEVRAFLAELARRHLVEASPYPPERSDGQAASDG